MIELALDTYGSGQSTKGFVVNNWVYDPMKTRPHYNGGWCVSDDLHHWLIDRQIQYKLAWQEPYNTWYLLVDNHWDALYITVAWL